LVARIFCRDVDANSAFTAHLIYVVIDEAAVHR
jgi:hypothetical protein